MDAEVVIRAQQGDRGAFACIVDEVLDRFLAVAHRILRDGALAEVATQAALLDIWRDLPRLRDADRFGATWACPWPPSPRPLGSPRAPCGRACIAV